MPYPFAHPAAVLPLVPLMGALAVPSALVIGSMVPDAWYLLPGLERADSHSAAGLVQFCLPVGLAAYFVWHLLLKQPLYAHFGRAAAPPRLPAVPWHAVLLSLLVGALTHLGWDGVAHSYEYRGFHVLQHASTLLGSAILGWWGWRRLGRPALLPLAAAGLALGALACALLWWVAGAELQALRDTLRKTFVAGTWIAGAALIAYGMLWRLRR